MPSSSPLALLGAFMPGTGLGSGLGWGLLVLLAGGVVYLLWLQRRLKDRISQLRAQREKVRGEERRVFDFLHELGEAFSHDLRPADLHRRIAEGAAKILEAHGALLYLVDKSGERLSPTAVTRHCPPLTPVPAHMLEQATSNPQAVDSWLRLHPVAPGEGVVGAVWSAGEPRRVLQADSEPGLDSTRGTPLHAESVLAAPLNYAGQKLGVLAVANGAMGAVFSDDDFLVFRAIADQAAFALFAAGMFAEAHEKRQLDRDVQVAREVQRILLPVSAPTALGFDIAGVNAPARGLSGDYYDYVKVDSTCLGVAIADVCGKGIPASLLMAMCRTVLRSVAAGQGSPSAVLRAVNAQLFPDIKEDMFISMAYVILDSVEGRLTLARAGHDAPLLFSAAQQTVTPLKPPGMALGVDSGGVFDRVLKEHSVVMEKGDCLLLYTDGITEALDADGSEYGLENVMQALRESAPKGAAAVIERISEDVRRHSAGLPQHDDITILAIVRSA